MDPRAVTAAKAFDRLLAVNGEIINIFSSVFFNSDGFALIMDSTTGLTIQRKAQPDSSVQLCFAAKTHVGHFDLRFYASKNLRELFDTPVSGDDSYFLPIQKQHTTDEIILNERYFKFPIWHLDDNQMNQTPAYQTELVSHVSQLHKSGFEYGEILLDLHHTNNNTHLNLKTMISDLHKLGFSVGMALNSYMPRPDNQTKEYFDSQNLINFHNENAANFFRQQLERLHAFYQFDSCHLDTSYLSDFLKDPNLVFFEYLPQRNLQSEFHNFVSYH